jgi:hypothetical protein
MILTLNPQPLEICKQKRDLSNKTNLLLSCGFKVVFVVLNRLEKCHNSTNPWQTPRKALYLPLINNESDEYKTMLPRRVTELRRDSGEEGGLCRQDGSGLPVDT